MGCCLFSGLIKEFFLPLQMVNFWVVTSFNGPIKELLPLQWLILGLYPFKWFEYGLYPISDLNMDLTPSVV